MASFLGKSDIAHIEAEIAGLMHRINERHAALSEFSRMLDSHAQIRGQIETLEGTLQAERMSAARARDLQTGSSTTLLNAVAAATAPIRAALSRTQECGQFSMGADPTFFHENGTIGMA
jgi:hypothetical protein